MLLRHRSYFESRVVELGETPVASSFRLSERVQVEVPVYDEHGGVVEKRKEYQQRVRMVAKSEEVDIVHKASDFSIQNALSTGVVQPVPSDYLKANLDDVGMVADQLNDPSIVDAVFNQQQESSLAPNSDAE